ncbi:hypothetical protein F66182_11350 [Fusarium sp. NRRL 66182]|nr:hypothetical protein F66182_11350 [Fusarium sp. NRRL 66182]
MEREIRMTQQRPIHLSSKDGSVGLIKLLCEKGASLEVRDAEGDRALCVAARNGHVAAVQTLLDFGSPLQLRFGIRSHEDSPLCLAAKGGHLSVVAVLIRHGASVLSKDEMGWTPASYAAYYGHPEVLEAIIAAEPSALSFLDFSNFSPDTVGVRSGLLGFSPDATVPPDQRSQVIEILERTRQQQPAPAPSMDERLVSSSQDSRTLVPLATPHRRLAPVLSSFSSNAITAAAASSWFPTTYEDLPNELPGTLEQGLPSSRSATPPHMHRGDREEGTVSAIFPPPTATLSPRNDQFGSYSDNLNDTINKIAPVSLDYRQPQAFNPSTFLPADRLAQSLAQLDLQLNNVKANTSHQDGEDEDEDEVEAEEEGHAEETSENELAELEGDLPPPYHAFSTPVLRKDEQPPANIMKQPLPRSIQPETRVPGT